MTAYELLDMIAAHGGVVALDGCSIRYDLSGDATPLLPQLFAHREDVRRILKEREAIPPVPTGFCLVTWSLKPGPLIVENTSVVGNSACFARERLRQLSAAMTDPTWGSIVPQLLDQLAQVGVTLTYR